MTMLQTTWESDDPKMAEVIRLINNEKDEAVQLEMEAALHIWQAQDCSRRAERIRASRRVLSHDV